ncbi:unnamed protein product [Rhizophagus irregularis]|nr:unnamed protein product [Rhizophagus irregularis]
MWTLRSKIQHLHFNPLLIKPFPTVPLFRFLYDQNHRLRNLLNSDETFIFNNTHIKMTPVRTLNPVTDNHFTLSDLSSMKNIDFSTGNYIPDPFPTGIPIQRMLKKYNRSELRHDRLTSPPDRKDKIAKNIYKDHTQNINTSVRYYSRRKNMMDYLTQLMNFYHNEMQKHQQDAGLLLFTAENHLSFTKS